MSEFILSEYVDSGDQIVRVSYEGFEVEICSLGKYDRHGNLLWNFDSWDYDTGYCIHREDALEQAKQVLKELSANTPMCPDCGSRHRRDIACSEAEIPF